MKNLSLNKSADEARITAECAEMLKRRGAVLLLPTETVYGFMCRWDDSEARERIYKIKRRSSDKPFQMLASSIAQAEKEGLIFDGEARRIAEKFFPGPLTLVVKNRDGGTTGLRIPKHQFILNIIRIIDSPLAATSANISGEPAALTLEDALRNLESLPDMAVDGGKIEAGAASTVVDASSSPFKILRPGPIKEEEIRKAVAGNNLLHRDGIGMQAAFNYCHIAGRHRVQRARILQCNLALCIVHVRYLRANRGCCGNRLAVSAIRCFRVQKIQILQAGPTCLA